jgi:hypothetical protein
MLERRHVLKHTKKYRIRSSPAISANKHCGETRKGNDGLMYTSVSNYRGICRWQKTTGSRARYVRKLYNKKSRSRAKSQKRSRSRKGKSKSRRRSRVTKLGKCRKYLASKIKQNMKEYHSGRYVSREQAIAVAYSMTRKKYPGCNRII